MSRFFVFSARKAAAAVMVASSSSMTGMTALAESKPSELAPVAPPSVDMKKAAIEVTKVTRIDVKNPSCTWDKSTDTVIVEPLQYSRIDDEYMKLDKYKAFQDGNALHDTLLKPTLLEKYEVYRKKDSDEILCVVKFGSMINGHPTFVHGGITSLVFDNSFGWLFLGLNLPMAVTANLQVNYRAPLPMNTTCVLKAKMNRIEGRKMFMEAKMYDMTGTLIADSTSLFVALKPHQAMAAKVRMNISEYAT